MKKICLIHPPRATQISGFTAGTRIPPIGAAYVAASLQKAGFETTIVDAIGEGIDQFYLVDNIPGVAIQGLKPEEILAMIPEDTTVIGLSCMFSSEWFIYRFIINHIREKFPHIKIIAGGEHVTADPESSLQNCPALDVCVLGEGEETAIELCKALTENTPLSEVNGICFRDGDKLKRTNSRKRIKNVDSIPAPQWKGVPLENYIARGYSMTSINRPSMPVVASRGCPYMCTFCTSPKMWGTDLNLRSPAEVVKEIKFYKENYNIEHIDFLDIVGFFNKQWVKELLELLIAENLNVTWLHGAGTRSEILDQEILDLFKKSNTLRILYAPETGSEVTIKKFNKRVNLSSLVKSMRTAHSLGIMMRAGIIYGFPGQTMGEVFTNIFFGFKLSILGVDDVVSHPFGAHPGSELYETLKKEGKIKVDELIKNNTYHFFLKDEAYARVGDLRSWSEEVPGWMMPFLQLGVMGINYFLLFLFHPRKLIRSLERVFINRKPLTLFDHVLYEFFIFRREMINSESITYK